MSISYPKTVLVPGSSPETCFRTWFPGTCLPTVGERNHVVQRFDAAFKEAAHPARGLADALLVFDHRDPHEALAVLAESDARRHHDAGFLDQQGRELHAADVAKGLRKRRPGEHRGVRRRYVPARPAERFHQRIAAF